MALSANGTALAQLCCRGRSHLPPLPRSRRWTHLVAVAAVSPLAAAACVGSDVREIAEAGDEQVERRTDNPIAVELELEGLELRPGFPRRLAGERTGGDGLLDFNGGGIRDTRFTFRYDLTGTLTGTQVLELATMHLLELGATLEAENQTERLFTATSLGDDLTITITDRGGVSGYDIGHVVEIHLDDE